MSFKNTEKDLLIEKHLKMIEHMYVNRKYKNINYNDKALDLPDDDYQVIVSISARKLN